MNFFVDVCAMIFVWHGWTMVGVRNKKLWVEISQSRIGEEGCTIDNIVCLKMTVQWPNILRNAS